jgi:hypothetical protein
MTTTRQHRRRVPAIHWQGASGALSPGAAFVLALIGTPQVQAQSYTALYRFTGGADGKYPDAGSILDAADDLYGTTQKGGGAGRGAVFKLNPAYC